MSEVGCFPARTAHASFGKAGLFDDFVAKFLDDGIRQDFFGHAFDLFFGGFARNAVQIEHEKFALADVTNLAESQRGESVLYGLALRIKDRALRHYPHMCFHRGHYTKPSAAAPE